MKRFFYIWIFAMLMALCGCGQIMPLEKPVSEAAVSDLDLLSETKVTDVSEMPVIYIYMEGEPGEEYAEADIAIGDEVAIAAVKLRGNSSKESAKKAYTVKFEDEQELLGMESGKKWALVSNPFDKSLLRPAVGFALAEALGLEYVSQTRLSKVWVDDTYMGIYTAMEPVEAGDGRVEIDVTSGGAAGPSCDFLLERNLGRYEDDKVYIDSSLGMRFEFNEPDEPDSMQQAECYGLLAAAEEAICSGDHEKYEQLIDVESFVNFYVFQEVIKDVDFGEYSTRYYFKDGVLYAGPPWDLDLTMGNVSAEKEEFKYAAYNNVEGAGDVVYQVLAGAGAYGADFEAASGDGQNGGGDESDPAAVFGGSAYGLWAATGDYYYWLCRDPWFMELVHQRWQAVRQVVENLAVDNELGENLIDRYLAAYEEELSGNFYGSGEGAAYESGDSVPGGGNCKDNCWTVDEPAHMSEWQEPAATYVGNVEMLRQWLIQRAVYLDSQFGPFVYTPALAVQ